MLFFVIFNVQMSKWINFGSFHFILAVFKGNSITDLFSIQETVKFLFTKFETAHVGIYKAFVNFWSKFCASFFMCHRFMKCRVGNHFGVLFFARFIGQNEYVTSVEFSLTIVTRKLSRCMYLDACIQMYSKVLNIWRSHEIWRNIKLDDVKFNGNAQVKGCSFFSLVQDYTLNSGIMMKFCLSN